MAVRPTGIELTAKIFPIALIMLLFKPTIEIDGQPIRAAWSTQFLPVYPGSHRISIYWKYLGLLRCNVAMTEVSLAEGEVIHLTYKARCIIYLRGKLAQSPAESVPVAA